MKNNNINNTNQVDVLNNIFIELQKQMNILNPQKRRPYKILYQGKHIHLTDDDIYYIVASKNYSEFHCN
jgi:hypothetical protein